MRQRRTFLAILTGAFCLLFLGGRGAAAGAGPEPPKLRLPSTARPIGYAVDLAIDPAKETFRGSIDIRARLDAKTDVLWLNAADLEIAKAAASFGGRAVGVRTVPSGSEFLGFVFERPVGPGELALHIEYTGRLDETSTQGLFRQKSGEDWYAFSQLEATDARRAFPCFDEPSYKVPWQLTLRIPKGTSAVSNTPIESETEGPDGMRTVRFKKTAPLPSYLVALAVGPFDYVDAGKAGRNHTPIRIVTPRGKAAQARYAASTSGPLLERLEAYFGMPYPFEKLDQLAIPLTVTFGAMENAGLITWAESILLAPPAEETIRFKRAQASINAHEIAHQWFGDLVTLAWWDDVWLNESFATWMADRTLTEWKPEWNEDVSRVVARSGVMAEDALVSARKIHQPIESNDDIVNAFDGISYQKGAAVLTMFEAYIGKEKFREGVRKYLAAHRFGNATSRDFLAAIEAASVPGVAAAFSSFLDQPGVPLVDVALDCSGEKPRLRLAQKRFLPVGTKGSVDLNWLVPVCIRAASGATPSRACELLTKPSGIQPTPTATCPVWLLANDGERGYYRAVYEGDLLEKLLAVADRELSIAERAGLILDVEALAVGGAIPMAQALALAPRFAGDPSRAVVEAVLKIAKDLRDQRLVPSDLRENYARFVSMTFGARARQLGFVERNGEDDETRLLREALVPFVATEGAEPELRAEARRLALAWLDDRSAVSAELAGAVLETAAAHGDRALFDRFRAALPVAQERRDRIRLYAALASFPDSVLVGEALALYLAPGTDAREAGKMFIVARGEETGLQASWKFLQANYDGILAKFPREATGFAPYFVEGFCDGAHRREVAEFFAGRAEKLPGGPRNLAQVLEGIDLCVALREVQEPSVREFLKKY